jgi:hypothetical protein
VPVRVVDFLWRERDRIPSDIDEPSLLMLLRARVDADTVDAALMEVRDEIERRGLDRFAGDDHSTASAT